MKETYNGPEDETATGPNFPRENKISVAIAPGQTITNLDVTDALPSNLQYMSVVETSIRGTSTTTTALSTPSTSTPGGTVTQQFASVTGTGAANDVTMTVQYYVPLKDSTGASVISPTTGAAVTSTDTSSAQGTWTPLNPNDTTGVYASNTATHVLNDRSLATQKSVADLTHPGGPIPSDTLQYTVSFEVSDYFAFQNLILTDLISDGQHFDPAFTPTLQVNGGTFTLAAQAMNSANYTVTGNYTGATPPPTNPDGTTSVAFRISDEMVTRGQNGQLIGGLVSGSSFLTAPGNGPVTGTITFRTVIQNRFTNTYPSGEPNINQGDVLNDNVSISGDVLSNATLTPIGSQATDGSAATVTIVQGSLTKSIYAVNGNTNFTSPPQIAAGDTVTYELKYDLPLASEEQLTLSDFLPLPIFDATTVTTFDSIENATAPASGHVQYGPSDTFHSLSSTDPTLTSSGTANSLTFAYPNYKDPNNGSATIDLLFTVTASNKPFADGLFLTNQAHVVEGTTDSTPINQDAIIQIKMTEPVLTVSKGAVASNDPNASITGSHGPAGFSSPGSSGFRATSAITSSGLASSPLNSNVTGIQANDLVTFAVVVQNTGSGLHGAFNVEFKDTLPPGFAIPSTGPNLSVTDGNGNLLPYTDLGGGLFGSNLELTDGNGTGALSAYSANSGTNLVVITYDLQATQSVAPAHTYTNTASVFTMPLRPAVPTSCPARSAPRPTRLYPTSKLPRR
ncbi:MAG: hypothetical protein ACLP7Q_27530 [Isosphaeraceae bacterium]